MWIKICGNTSLEDVQMAEEAGADAAGFVFASSPRRVTAGQIAEMMQGVPLDLTQIGVFNTQDFDEIVFALRTAGLHGVQLHGELDFSLADRLRREFGPRFFLVQTLHWDIGGDPGRAQDRLRNELRAIARYSAIDAVLLDARTPTASGGTGKTFDWKRAREILSSEAGPTRVIVAGGLHPGNVREAILTLRPWGVDVASGVEYAPGKKNHEILKDFIYAARVAFREIEPPVMRPVESGSGVR